MPGCVPVEGAGVAMPGCVVLGRLGATPGCAKVGAGMVPGCVPRAGAAGKLGGAAGKLGGAAGKLGAAAVPGCVPPGGGGVVPGCVPTGRSPAGPGVAVGAVGKRAPGTPMRGTGRTAGAPRRGADGHHERWRHSP